MTQSIINFINRFDDVDLTRPSTAPSPSDTLQNRANISVLASLRTGLEPTKTSDIFSSMKPTTDTTKSTNWLGIVGESSDDEQPPPRGIPKTEPVVTTLVRKTPLIPAQEPAPPPVIEPPKKSRLDALIDDDLQSFATEKITPQPSTNSNNRTQDFWLDDRTSSNKRPPTGGITKTPSFTDNQPIKSSTKSLFDTKPDPSN